MGSNPIGSINPEQPAENNTISSFAVASLDEPRFALLKQSTPPLINHADKAAKPLTAPDGLNTLQATFKGVSTLLFTKCNLQIPLSTAGQILVLGACLVLSVPSWAQDVAEDASDMSEDAAGDGASDGGEDLSSAGLVGGACESTEICQGALICIGPPTDPQFTNGYCGQAGCLFQNQCTSGGICGNVFGRRYCLQACADLGGCRPGYLCHELEPEISVCIPECGTHDDCRNPEQHCDEDSGLCEDGAPMGEDMGVPDMTVEDVQDTGPVDVVTTDDPIVDTGVLDQTATEMQSDAEGSGSEESFDSFFQGQCGCGLVPNHRASLVGLLILLMGWTTRRTQRTGRR